MKKAKWICHILHWNCLIKHVIEGRIEVMGRKVRRRKQFLDDFTEKRILEKCKRKH
jgi:predicted ester cyclase